MATQKPLIEMIPELIQHIYANQDYLQFNLRVFNILEGQLKREIEDSLRAEILSPSALQRCLQRITPVNVLRKATDKLSKVYIEAPIRNADKKQDVDLMDNIVRIANVDKAMMQANRLLNAQHSCAIEPYIDKGKQRLRVLPNHTFLPYSDDPMNPMNMTVFIKLLGSETIIDRTTYDGEGNNQEQQKNHIRVVNIYQAFSDDEIIIFDDRGIRTDKMVQMGLDGSNPFGVIPQEYVNSSEFMLLPYPNQAGLDISVLIPKLLTDLNYAVQFLSHSIIWSKNVNLNEVQLNPDTIVDLGDDSGDGSTPEIGTIEPRVEIESQLQLIEFELSAYLSSIGIKAATQGSMMPGREASGFAKAMDESDTTAVRKEQSELFRHTEKSLWSKLAKIQKVWSRNREVEESRQFSDSFDESFSVKFAEMKILKTDAEKVNEVKALRELGLMTKEQAIRALKPDFTDEQVKRHVKEVEKEAKANAPDLNKMVSDFKKPRDQVQEQRDEELGLDGGAETDSNN